MKKIIPPDSLIGYLPLFWPMLIFPAVFVPYRLWGIAPFANLTRAVLFGESGNPLWLAFHAEETIIFFWLTVSAVVILAGTVMAILRVRPWYFIPVYLLVMVSLCGVFALAFYSLMA